MEKLVFFTLAKSINNNMKSLWMFAYEALDKERTTTLCVYFFSHALCLVVNLEFIVSWTIFFCIGFRSKQWTSSKERSFWLFGFFLELNQVLMNRSHSNWIITGQSQSILLCTLNSSIVSINSIYFSHFGIFNKKFFFFVLKNKLFESEYFQHEIRFAWMKKWKYENWS